MANKSQIESPEEFARKAAADGNPLMPTKATTAQLADVPAGQNRPPIGPHLTPAEPAVVAYDRLCAAMETIAARLVLVTQDLCDHRQNGSHPVNDAKGGTHYECPRCGLSSLANFPTKKR